MATFMASLQQRAATPSTPTHSPHPSLHSRSSFPSHPYSLSLHEYRKQLSLPCTPDFTGSKRVKRKTAASSLKTSKHAPRVTFTELDHPSVDGKGPLVRRLADETQPLLGPPSPESPVLDPFNRKPAGDVRHTSLQDSSNLLERPLGFAKKLASRKRLPRPDNIKLAQAPPRESLHSDTSSIDLLSSAGFSESSTFTLSKYPFPLPPSRVKFERFSNINVLPAPPHRQQDISLVLPDTPPATPATLHYRGASFDLVNPRKSLFNSNFEPPEDPDLETGNELVDRIPSLKGLLPEDMAGDSDNLHKEEASKPEQQGRKIFADLETAYASIAQQKAHGSRDSIIQSPQRRMASVEALTSPPAGVKQSEVRTPRSVSAGHPASFLSSPSKTPRGLSFMDRVKERLLGSPVKPDDGKEQELQELNSDGTPTKQRTLQTASEEALLPRDVATGDEEEVEDRLSLDNSGWESISENPTEPRYSLAPSSVYPESKRASRPYSLAASSIYQDPGIPPNSAYFGPISNRKSVPWGVRNRATDYSSEMSMTADMWEFKPARNSYQANSGYSRRPSQMNETTLGSIIDRYGNDAPIGKPTGSSVAASFIDSQHDSMMTDQVEGTVRLRHVHTSTPDIHADEGVRPELIQEPSLSSDVQAAVHSSPAYERARLPRLQTSIEPRIGSPPLRSPPPMGPAPRNTLFTRGSDVLSGQLSYGDTNRLLDLFPSSGSPVSEPIVRHLSPLQGDGLPESPLQSIIDQYSAQSSPMEREDPFYLENAVQPHRDSWESCSTNSSGGGILGEQETTFEERAAIPEVYLEDQGHHEVGNGDIADEIPAIWAGKVSPVSKSQRTLQIDDAANADIPAIWARKVSPMAKSQHSFPGQVAPTDSSGGYRCDAEAGRVADEGASGFHTDSSIYHDASLDTSPVHGKGKQALRRKPSCEELSPTKSVATDLIPKRSDTNPWRNKRKGAAAESSPTTPGKGIPRFPRESEMFVDSYEGDLSRAFPSEEEVRAGRVELHDPPSSPPMRHPENPFGSPVYSTPGSSQPFSSPSAPLLPRSRFGPGSPSPLAQHLPFPTHHELRSPTSSRTPLLPGHRHFEHFYSPTADGIGAALSAPSTAAAVFPGAAHAIARTPSRCSVVSTLSLTPSTGDPRLDSMRETRRMRPRATVHYDETLMQRRLEERRRICERLDAKTLPEPPKTSPRTGGVVDPLHPRAAVRGQRSVMPLRLGSDSALHSTTSFGTQVRQHRRASDVEAARRPWYERSFLTPTTVSPPARYRSPHLSGMRGAPRPERPLYEDSPVRQDDLSWKIFWIFGLFPPFGVLIWTGHFDVLMPYFTEGELEAVGLEQKKTALIVAISECVALLFLFWVLKMANVV